MNKSPATHLTLKLPPELTEEVRELAARHRTWPVHVVAVLLRHALEAKDEPGVVEALDDVAHESHLVRSEIGRRAMAARWGKGRTL